MIINLNKLKSTAFSINPDWLKALREKKLQDFLERGFPKRTEEAWKYIDLTSLSKESFIFNSLEEKKKKLDPFPPFQPVNQSPSPSLVFVNGYFRAEYSALNSIPPEVTITSLESAIKNHESLVKRFISADNLTHNPFVDLNTAFLMDGLFLHVPQNVSLKEPIHCIYLNEKDQGMSHVRKILMLEENSHLTFIEHFWGDHQAQYFHNHVTQIQLERSSQLSYYKIQQESAKAYHFSNTQVLQQANSEFSAFHASGGGKLSREDVQVKLIGKQAKCELKGFYVPQNQQCMDHHIEADHCAEQTQSKQYYKGVLKDRSKAIFNGKVKVHKGAKQAIARQSNPNILLSDTAELDTKPELEIDTDDVKCSHGATVGPLEQEVIFYLQSRGMSKETASRLLIDAFFNELIDPIPFPKMKQKLNMLVKYA